MNKIVPMLFDYDLATEQQYGEQAFFKTSFEMYTISQGGQEV